jgi:hypothetical protein
MLCKNKWINSIGTWVRVGEYSGGGGGLRLLWGRNGDTRISVTVGHPWPHNGFLMDN